MIETQEAILDHQFRNYVLLGIGAVCVLLLCDLFCDRRNF